MKTILATEIQIGDTLRTTFGTDIVVEKFYSWEARDLGPRVSLPPCVLIFWEGGRFTHTFDEGETVKLVKRAKSDETQNTDGESAQGEEIEQARSADK